MKRKKLILCFIGAVLLMTGCGGEASLPVYSNLSEEQVREQFETELIQAGAAETDAQKSMAIVKEYNDTIQNTSLVEEGYASFDMTMPEYDIDAIQDLWMKNNPDFIGYNCRITAFGLMKDLITVQDTGGRNTEYLFLDEAALDAGELFTAEEREKFETVFSEIKTDASTDTKKQIGVQREYWKKAGVTFDGESKLSLITVYLHSHIDENENSLIAGSESSRNRCCIFWSGIYLNDGFRFTYTTGRNSIKCCLRRRKDQHGENGKIDMAVPSG